MCASMLESLPTLTMKITEQQLYDYADVSQDNNPLHLDKEFAATTSFGAVSYTHLPLPTSDLV